MFGILKYFIKLVQFAIAAVLTVLVLMYATDRYTEWRKSNQVPRYVERVEQAVLSISRTVVGCIEIEHPTGSGLVRDEALQHWTDTVPPVLDDRLTDGSPIEIDWDGSPGAEGQSASQEEQDRYAVNVDKLEQLTAKLSANK